MGRSPLFNKRSVEKALDNIYYVNHRCWSSLKKIQYFLFDYSNCLNMILLFGALHPFGSQNAAHNVLPQELRDQYSCDPIVDSLLFFRIYLILLGSHFVEFFQGLLINIVIDLASYHFLEQVKSFSTNATCAVTIPLQKQFYSFKRFFLLKGVGKDQPDDIWNYVSILHLF